MYKFSSVTTQTEPKKHPPPKKNTQKNSKRDQGYDYDVQAQQVKKTKHYHLHFKNALFEN